MKTETIRTAISNGDLELRKEGLRELCKELLDGALSEDQEQLLITTFRQEDDLVIKLRLTQFLPEIKNKQGAVSALIDALGERDDKVSGYGNLQHYAGIALARIGDPSTIPALEAWLKFVKTTGRTGDSSRPEGADSEVYNGLVSKAIESAEKAIEILNAKIEQAGNGPHGPNP